MSVQEWIAEHPDGELRVAPDASLGEVVEIILTSGGCRDLFVVDGDGKLLGVITKRRAAELMLSEYHERRTSRHIMEHVSGGCAEEIMARAERVTADDDLQEAMQTLLHSGCEDLAVVDEEDRLIGSINLSDLLRWEVEHPKEKDDEGEEG